MSRKKDRERIYLDEARRASDLFPTVEPISHDPLDFLFPRNTGTLGVEMTELCCEDERREGARLGHVAPRAKQIYLQRARGACVSVSPVFSTAATAMPVHELARDLADFVYRHREDRGNFTWDCCKDMPKGYCLFDVN